jgi:hypothetical protein
MTAAADRDHLFAPSDTERRSQEFNRNLMQLKHLIGQDRHSSASKAAPPEIERQAMARTSAEVPLQDPRLQDAEDDYGDHCLAAPGTVCHSLARSRPSTLGAKQSLNGRLDQ